LKVASYGHSESSPKSNLKVISQWHLLARLSSRTMSPHLLDPLCVTARCAYGAPDCSARKCHGYPVSQRSANRKEKYCTESITEMESRGCCRIPVRERRGWVSRRRSHIHTRIDCVGWSDWTSLESMSNRRICCDLKLI